MKLTKCEKQVLKLMDDVPVLGFEKFVAKQIDCSVEKIAKIKAKLLKEGFVKTMKLPNDESAWFFYTEKVTDKLIDTELDYKMKYGSEKTRVGASPNIEQKLN